MSKTIASLAGFAAVGLACFTPAPASAATTGCPPSLSGFVLWDIDAEPYGADNLADDFGNGDGWVCARPMRLVTDEDGNPFQLYVFVDNRVPVD